MKVDLTPDAKRWVEDEIASGRSSTPADALQHAVEAAKLAQILIELRDAEMGGGAHSSEDVRAYARERLDGQAGGTTGRG